MSRNSSSVVFGCSLVLIVCLFLVGLMAYRPVDYGTVRLVTRFGELTGKVLEPGLNWIVPLVNGTVEVPTQIKTYEASSHPESSGADYTDYPVNANTTDGQQIQVKYTVVFKILSSHAVEITDNVGKTNMIVENIVKAQSRNLTRLFAQNYMAEDLFSGPGILDYENEIATQLSLEFSRYG